MHSHVGEWLLPPVHLLSEHMLSAVWTPLHLSVHINVRINVAMKNSCSLSSELINIDEGANTTERIQ